MRRSTRAGATALLFGVLCPAAAAPGDIVITADRKVAAWRVALEGSLQDAARKLEDPECQAVLGDFRDASGRTLRENLDALGPTPERYLLRWMVFGDGGEQKACGRPSVLAVTPPGSRVVLLCPRFAMASPRSGLGRANALIHETMHTLGMGENPPTSREINRAIEARCGR